MAKTGIAERSEGLGGGFAMKGSQPKFGGSSSSGFGMGGGMTKDQVPLKSSSAFGKAVSTSTGFEAGSGFGTGVGMAKIGNADKSDGFGGGDAMKGSQSTFGGSLSQGFGKGISSDGGMTKEQGLFKSGSSFVKDASKKTISSSPEFAAGPGSVKGSPFTKAGSGGVGSGGSGFPSKNSSTDSGGLSKSFGAAAEGLQPGFQNQSLSSSQKGGASFSDSSLPFGKNLGAPTTTQTPGFGPRPGVMGGGTKTSLSPPGVGEASKGVAGFGSSSPGFSGGLGPSSGTPGVMKGKQSSTFGGSSTPGFGAGGGMAKANIADKSEGLGGGFTTKGSQSTFSGSSSPGFEMGGGMTKGQGQMKSNSEFGMDSSKKGVSSLPGFGAGSGPLKGSIDSGGFGKGGIPSISNSFGTAKMDGGSGFSSVGKKSPFLSGVGGGSKEAPGVGSPSPGFGGGLGQNSGTPGAMKVQQPSTFGGSSIPGFGAGGGMTKNSNVDKSERLGGGDSMKESMKFGGSPSQGFAGEFSSGGSMMKDQGTLKSSATFTKDSSMKAVSSFPGFGAGPGSFKGRIDSGGFGKGGMPSMPSSFGASKMGEVGTGFASMEKKSSSPSGTSSTGRSSGLGSSSLGFGGGFGSSAAPDAMKGKQSSTFVSSSSPGYSAGAGIQDTNADKFGGNAMKGSQSKFGGSPSPGFGGGINTGGVSKSNAAFGLDSSTKSVSSLPGFGAGPGSLKGSIDSGGFGKGGMPSMPSLFEASKMGEVGAGFEKSSSPSGTSSTGRSAGFGLSLQGLGGGFGSSAAPDGMKGKQSSTFGISSSPGFDAGGGMQDKNADKFGGNAMKGSQSKFGGSPSPGFGGGINTGGVSKSNAAFGLDSSTKSVSSLPGFGAGPGSLKGSIDSGGIGKGGMPSTPNSFSVPKTTTSSSGYSKGVGPPQGMASVPKAISVPNGFVTMKGKDSSGALGATFDASEKMRTKQIGKIGGFAAGNGSGMPFTPKGDFMIGDDGDSKLLNFQQAGSFGGPNSPLKGSLDRKQPGGLGVGPGTVILTASKGFGGGTAPRQFGSASINSQMLAAFRPGSGYSKQSMSSFREGDTPSPSPLFGNPDESQNQTEEYPDSMRKFRSG